MAFLDTVKIPLFAASVGKDGSDANDVKGLRDRCAIRRVLAYNPLH
jgi:hypothetical protein